MTWKINSYFSATGLSNATNIPPVYDGKNVWIMQTNGDVKVVEFWGPYADDSIYPNVSNTRWNEAEVDSVTYASVGPKCRVIKTIPFGYVGDIGIYNDRLYCFNGSILSYISLNANDGDVPTVGITIVNAPSYVAAGLVSIGNSNFIITDNKLFFVSAHSALQVGTDKQRLRYINLSTMTTVNVGSLPDRKQTEKRYLVLANDKIYVSSMNTMQVHQYNVSTRSYLTSVTINRDVEKLIRMDNDVYILSSVKGRTTLGIASMVSQLTQSDIVTHKYGINGGGTAMASTSNYVWFVSDDKKIQRTRKSDNNTFLANGESPDYTIELVDSKGNDIGDVLNIITTPSITYQYFDGTAFQDVTIPEYLLVVTANAVFTVLANSSLFWKSSYEMNQYTAVSTGLQSYKQG